MSKDEIVNDENVEPEEPGDELEADYPLGDSMDDTAMFQQTENDILEQIQRQEEKDFEAEERKILEQINAGLYMYFIYSVFENVSHVFTFFYSNIFQI